MPARPTKPKIPPRNTSPDGTTAYAKAVAAGRIVAGPHVRAACRRHLEDLKEGRKRGLYWDLAAAQRAINFFPSVLRLSEGQFEGIPFDLDPHQQFIVGSIFGWKKGGPTGQRARNLNLDLLKRRFTRAYVEEGKGNGKSPLAGGIGLYGMAADNEAGAQVYAAGARKEQAGILFQDAVKMARQSPALSAKITFSGANPVWNMAMLAGKQAGSFFRPISREAGRSGSGPRPHFALCDEVHEHKDRHVMEMLERGFKFRRQPLLLMITNSGTDRNSICWEEHEHAVKVAHGDKLDDATFSYVCGLDDSDDPLQDPSCWIKANPMLGKILTHEYLASVVAQANAIPGKANGVLRLHFCVWTSAEGAWINRSVWEACEDKTLELDDFVGQRCWAGLDLAELKDLAGKALVFEDGYTDPDEKHPIGQPKFAAFVHGYTPADTMLERGKADGVDYALWHKQGFITATPGPVIRLDFVADDLLQDKQRFDLEAVAYDRHLIKHFETAVGELGGTLPVIEHPQGVATRKDSPLWMPGSINDLETLILEKRIRFHISLALRAHVDGARFWRSPAGLRRFDKQAPGSRIDLVVALAMAVGAAIGKVGENKREYQIMVFGQR